MANEAKNLQNTTPETKDESFFSKVVTEDADMVSFQTLKGNSVVWNQLVQKGAQGETTYNRLTFYPQENGEVLITGVATENSYISMGHYLGYAYKSVANHKAFVQIFGDATRTMELYVTDDLQKTTNLGIVQWGTVAAGSVLYIPKGYDCGQGVRLRFIVNDLTQMFGAGNEPSTYEEFLQRKPKVADEFAYNEGTIVNNKVEKVVTTGRNLCPYLEQGTLNIYNGSEQPNTTRVRTPFIPISNKHSYCTMLNKWSIRNGCFYDRNKNFISSGYPSTSNGVLDSSAIPANAAFCRLVYSAQNGNDVVTPSYDVFMFAVGNTTIPTTKYEPYEEHTLDLAWVKEIKDAEGVKLFEDGLRGADDVFDEAKAKVATKRMGIIDLGNLDWLYQDRNIFLSSPIPNVKSVAVSDYDGRLKGVLCDKYVAAKSQSTTELQNGEWLRNIDKIYIRDTNYADIVAFKEAVRGLKLIYELAEPIEVELPHGINHTLPVWKDGMMYAESSQSSTPIVCTNAYYTNIRESVKKFIGDADSIYANTSGYNAHGT